MVENKQHIDAQAVEELRDNIAERGWKNSAQFMVGEIEFITDLCAAQQLSVNEIWEFVRDMRITLRTLSQVQDDPYEEQVLRLGKAVASFNATSRDCRHRNDRQGAAGACGDDPKGLVKEWTLSRATAWRDHLDQARQVFEACCASLRQHLDGVLKQHNEAALKCVDEMEQRIPLLCSGRLADVAAQMEAINQVVLLSGKLLVYADDRESLSSFSNYLLPARDEQQAFQMRAGFCEAVLGNDLDGQQDWLKQIDCLEWLRAQAKRIAARFEEDGRLDSKGKRIHERALLDPLDENSGDLRSVGTLDDASFKVAAHPDVRLEIGDLDGVLKQAGLNPRQRKALLMRRNGTIMKHRDVNEWKRSQRAIDSRRSELVAAIAAATKKKVINSPSISAGSQSGVIREGAAYTRPLPDEDKPSKNHSGAEPERPKWFEKTPPPISRSDRKRKNLFKKVSPKHEL